MTHILYHHQICPFSRQIRIFLKELNISHKLIKEDYWLGRREFLQINPAGGIPVLLYSTDIETPELGALGTPKYHNPSSCSTHFCIIGFYSIIEHLNDHFRHFFLMPSDIVARIQTRNFISWFNEKFYQEVTKILIDEKIISTSTHQREPSSAHIRVAKSNLVQHFKFLATHLRSNAFIACEKITCADIAAAAHISIIDYFGEINWDHWDIIKQWYSVIKSRPSFRLILADRIAGFNPPIHYNALDL